VQITEEDRQLGLDAARQAASGKNPPSWVTDEDKWEKAKEAADKPDYDACVIAIYENLGGTTKGASMPASAPFAWPDPARGAALGPGRAQAGSTEVKNPSSNVGASIAHDNASMPISSRSVEEVSNPFSGLVQNQVTHAGVGAAVEARTP
jgi:hypothetical protein